MDNINAIVEKILEGADVRTVLTEDDLTDRNDRYYTNIFKEVFDTPSAKYYSIIADTEKMVDDGTVTLSITRKSAEVPDDEKDYGIPFKNKDDLPSSLEHAVNLILTDLRKQGNKVVSTECTPNAYKITFKV